MRTIAFDEAIYRLVPMAVTEEMAEAAMFAAGERKSIGAKIAAAIATVPADLPGVVECSGEPCGYTVIGNGLQYFTHSAAVASQWPGAVPVFTHPPAQPDTEALQARIAELEAKLEVDPRCNYDGIDCRDVTIKELEAQLLASGKYAELLTHRVITCGVAASHSDANLSHTGAYKSKWNSAQADEVRLLRDRCDKAEAQLAAQAGQEPVAWVRRHPDGALTAEFLEDAVIEPVRKRSGAWVPLYLSPPAPANSIAIVQAALDDVDALAQEIRRIDGNHRMGAGALAEALMPFVDSIAASKRDDVAGDARDAARYRFAIALEDNAEMLYAAVLNNAPDHDAIGRAIDVAIAASKEEPL